MSLEGKIAIVTGSGQGIGRAIAFSLAGNGAIPVITDINTSAAEKVKTEIEKISSEIINADILKMIYKDFDKIYDDLDFDDRQKAVRLLIKEIKLYHHKDDSVNTKIEMALWNKQSLGPLMLSESESSTFGRSGLRR